MELLSFGTVNFIKPKKQRLTALLFSDAGLGGSCRFIVSLRTAAKLEKSSYHSQ